MLITKNNFYVLTGGPGSGKSSLIDCLKKRGFDNIAESARPIIKERLLNGLSPRPEPDAFARQLFVRDLSNFTLHTKVTSTVFFDRSFVDSAGMIFHSDQLHFDIIKSIIKEFRYNQNIFIFPPWKEIYDNDDERDQSFEEAVAIYGRIRNWYELNHYTVVEVPKVTIEDRADFILSQIQESLSPLASLLQENTISKNSPILQ